MQAEGKLSLRLGSNPSHEGVEIQMTQADRVHSTPPLNSSATPERTAPEGAQLSPSSPISASHPGASQTTRDPTEPAAAEPTCMPRAGGAVLSRRSLMNKIVAITTAAAVPTVAPAMPATEDTRAADSAKRAEEVVDLLRTRYVRRLENG